MSVKVPFLPVHGAGEAKLFTRLVLEMSVFNEALMSIEWCKHVNGATVLPKLPVYLRMSYERWERNQRVKDAVWSSKTELHLLEVVNNTNMLLPTNFIQNQTADLYCNSTEDVFDGDASGCSNMVQAFSGGSRFGPWADVAMPIPMSQPYYLAIQPREIQETLIVGGLLIGLTPDNLPMEPVCKCGQRGKDFTTRKRRSCT